MIVVSDTSPITALLAVGMEDLLRNLFGEVIIPEAVRDELLRGHPALPGWLRVEPVRNADEALRFAMTVDRGEAEAIELARELHADRLLIDERKGRRLAELEGVPVIGLVGVVLLARRKQMISSARGLLLRLPSSVCFYLGTSVSRLLPSSLRCQIPKVPH
jgi:predicted nucleic acid-binding protein